MLSISQPVRGAGKGNYYLNLAREDYYTRGGEPPGRWLGEGAVALGLRGEVEAGELRRVMKGQDPLGGGYLVSNAEDPNRRSFWDLTFSAPKSVSAVWSQASPKVAREIQAAQAEAVKAAIEYIENNCAVTRRGACGCREERVSIVVACFEHGTSRALDPQLHTHCLVQNLAIRKDGRIGAINSRAIFRHQMTIGAIYRAELAAQLERRLSLVAERKGKVFELEGVSEKLIEEFSKRRRAIQRELQERGFSSLKSADIAALNTREKKENVPRQELFAEWQVVGRKYGWSTEQVDKLIQREPPRRVFEKERASAIEQALGGLTRQRSFFSAREMVRAVAEEAQGRGLGAREVIASTNRVLAGASEVIPLGSYKWESVYSTKEMLRVEKELLDLAVGGSKETRFIVPERTVGRVFALNPTISEEQKLAVEHITRRPGMIKVVSGMAGTGKSFMLGIARECWEREGYRVIGGALAGKAAQGLSEGSGIKSDTLHTLQYLMEEGRVKIDEKTIVVIDEAAMVGTRQLASVVQGVVKRGGKVVLVGDERQLQSIEAGGAFVAISRRIGRTELKENRRQKEDWAKRAVALFSMGYSTMALCEYAERGLVHVGGDKDAVMGELVDDWARQGVKSPGEHLILAAEKQDVFELNRLSQMRRRDMLEGKPARQGEVEFFKGDRIMMTRNSRVVGVKNGQLGTVQRVNSMLGSITVVMDSGAMVAFSLNDYPHVELGYAVTTHKAQGMTAMDAYILVGGSMQDREVTYVQASRGRGTTRFYMTKEDAGENLADIAEQMGRSHQKEMALTVMSHGRKESLTQKIS